MSIATESYANPDWEFSDRIRKVRRSIAGMTQEQMATELGVTQKAYAAWESGKNKPDDIVAIAKRIAFRWRGRVTASWMLGIEDDTPQPPPGGGVEPPGGIEPPTYSLLVGPWAAKSQPIHGPRPAGQQPSAA